jgi:hypothetical protein
MLITYLLTDNYDHGEHVVLCLYLFTHLFLVVYDPLQLSSQSKIVVRHMRRLIADV